MSQTRSATLGKPSLAVEKMVVCLVNHSKRLFPAKLLFVHVINPPPPYTQQK